MQRVNVLLHEYVNKSVVAWIFEYNIYICIFIDLCKWGSTLTIIGSNSYNDYYYYTIIATSWVLNVIGHWFKFLMWKNLYLCFTTSWEKLLLLFHFIDRNKCTKASFPKVICWHRLRLNSLSPELILLNIIPCCSFNLDIPSYLRNCTYMLPCCMVPY